ncbi:hypothetical protein TSAR_001789 [Trichomalopsis sarcophagae]|uniref:SWIM-type domain-containing protein n=1 Tax=Trichomalopsis sarcophagae TaxID=543379 RepID=A0A232EFD4_9HYME|nr:hypothetical protein TSAR_001789 [Trichomalopsis sarcophagae]
MHSLIVLIFLVEDGNFLTEIVGVGIVRREDQDTMDWIMSSFKKHHHNNFQIIKYFMSDKNQTQRQAVKKICPNIVLLICLYHTIQIWKRQLSKMNLSSKQKEFYLDELKKLAYAENINIYEYRLREMVKECPECILSYFFQNWDDIKLQWTCYNEHHGTFYNRTNNRTESINQKLKQVIDKMNKMSNPLQAVTHFFTWKNFHDNENKRKIMRNFGSILQREQSEDEKKYMNYLMDGPGEIVLNEIKNKNYITFDNDNQNNTIFTIAKSKRETTYKECNCTISIAYKLPCRHIFAAHI